MIAMINEMNTNASPIEMSMESVISVLTVLTMTIVPVLVTVV